MNILVNLLGRIAYTPPPWLAAINRFRKKHIAAFWVSMMIVVTAILAAGYWVSLPGPIRITAQINPPGPPDDGEKPVPVPLKIGFEYDLESLDSQQPAPEGPPSVARIDRIGKPLDNIRLTPGMPGRWQWIDDHTLTFAPERAWPAGTRYEVEIPPDIFTPETRPAKGPYEFETPALEASIESIEFFQNPADNADRKVVATLVFSHPVDRESLEQHLSLSMRPSREDAQTPPVPVKWSVTCDKSGRQAYLSSVPVELPPQPNSIRLILSPGVAAIAGGSPTKKPLTETVVIPDRTSFLKVSQAEARIVVNEHQEPQQVLTLAFTDDIHIDEIRNKLNLYLLPKRNNRYWESPREVTDQVLAGAGKLPLSILPNERPAASAYHVIFDAPENRYLYLRMDPHFVSANGFVHEHLYDAVMAVPEYPREVKLAGEGSLLTLSGQRELGVMARGLTALKVSVGRLLPRQLVHLITQTDGDIRDPYFFNGTFTAANIATFSHEIIDFKALHPGKANYTTLDMSRHLPKNRGAFGLFFVTVQGWDRQHHHAVYGIKDARLILITDLGLLVKNNTDGSHELFVQSLSTGKPVVGAKVQLLGKNGLPLMQGATSTRGHAHIDVTRDFKNEKRPSVYLVKTDGDTAFIPFDGHARQINTSRYDVGGVRGHQAQKGALTAFIFSDRGIYRPGETVNLGFIVKKSPLDNITDIPLELAIAGPRGNMVKTEKRILPEKGFFDLSWATAAASDTGRYRVSLYLVHDNQRRGRLLGSAGFTLEAFVPDTMKIESRLMDVSDRGWATAPTLSARISLKNLFGSPAQGRRIQARVRIRPARFLFDEFSDFYFFNPQAQDDNEPLRIDESLEPVATDADGRARFEIPLDRFRQGTYQLDLFVEGFGPGGGRSVTARNRALISPLPHLVGFKSDGDLGFIHAGASRKVDWIAVDSRLASVDLSDLTLRRLRIDHLSTLVKQPNETFKYQTVDIEKEIDSRTFAIKRSGTQTDLTTDTPGDWAIEIHGPDGLRLARLTYTVVGHGNLTGRLEKEAALQLKLDKSDYRAGDTVTLSIAAPYTGTGLITIESDRVHAFKWFTATTSSTLTSIRLPNDLEGNAYVNVSFVRDAGSPEIFTSPLSTSVAPITIDRGRRRMQVSLNVPELVRPGKPLTIGYTAGKPSKVAVFAVDAGILQVAGYRTPRPLDHFLRKRALEVTTLQMLDLILPEYQQIRRAMASGGGAMLKAVAANLNPFARRTDAPAVFWSGIVDGGPDERTVSFTVPETFAGRLTVMAVAVGNDAVGTAEANTLVRGAFVLSPAVLFHAAPGDEFEATFGVTNLVKGSGAKAAVAVHIEASDNLELMGAPATQLAIDEGSEGCAQFRIKAGPSPGPASLTFFARLGQDEARRTVGLSIRPAMPFHTTFDSGHAENGAVRLEPTRRIFPELAEQRAAASASPLVLVEALTTYLKKFPHGCTEQVVSQVFPLVGLLNHPAYASDRAGLEKRFDVLMGRLRQRQLADGGFSFWPGGDVSADVPSVYVMHFLLESRETGFVVPARMLQRGADYLQEIASQDREALVDFGVQAQAIYLLTRMGRTTTNLLVRLQETLQDRYPDDWQTDLAAVYMAAAYRLLKMDDAADQLAGKYAFGTDKRKTYGDFDHPLTRDAQALYLLSRHFEARAGKIEGRDLLRLVDPIFRGRANTIGASYTILALGAYGRLALTDKGKETVQFEMETDDGIKRVLDMLDSPFPTAAYQGDARRIAIRSDDPFYYLNIQSGFDRIPPAQPLRKGMEIHREFINENGEAIQGFIQGQEATVQLRIRSLETPHIANVAIVDLLPGGFEVIRSSVPRTKQGWQADYVDIREDRIVFYGSVTTSVKTLTYRVKVTAPGSFVLPPVLASSMYDRSLKAFTTAGKVTVTPAP